MNNDKQFMFRWLEEQMLDIAEWYIQVHTAKLMVIAQTVLVNFDSSWNALTVEAWTEKNMIEGLRTVAWTLLAILIKLA